MAVYKVIQDIEAEDKILGPLTLKSFVYAAIAGVLAFINVRLLISGTPLPLRLLLILLLSFPMALFGVLASPLGRDQPTEVWLLSHIQFFLKPHQRVWDQLGANKLVTITAPKIVSRQLTKGFSQSEVQSRLQALATTLDSHGWAIKNSAVSLDDQQTYLEQRTGSDRLVGASTLARPAPVIDVHPADDILDEQNNATAQHFNELMQVADTQRRQTILDRISSARKKGAEILSGDDPRLNSQAATSSRVDDDTSEDSVKEVPSNRRKPKVEIHPTRTNHHAKKPAPSKHQTKTEKKLANTVTAEGRADRLELAQSGNDLSVASIAHLANRRSQSTQIDPNEVSVPLH